MEMVLAYLYKNFKSIHIIAPNIKMGGGLELLLYLYEYVYINYKQYNFIFYIDKSLENKIICKKNIDVVVLNSKVSKIKLFSKKFSNALYFGNLPPLVKSKNSLVYFHNPYLLENYKELLRTSLKFFLKYSLQQIYIKYFIKNLDFVAVQNNIIKNNFIKKYNFDKVKILPFFRLCEKNKYKDISKIYDFCYISLGYPHKNHIKLLKACEILSNLNYKFSIAMTIEKEYFKLIDMIKSINSKNNIKIINLGKITKNEVNLVYAKSKCLVFPSIKETFGLSLIEASHMGLDIIASDLEYVYEVVNPSMVFDPFSSDDIARCIANYLKGNIKRSNGIITNKIDDLINILIKE